MNFHRITHSMLAIALGCGLLIPAALLGAGEKKDAKAEKKEEAKGETSYPIDICVMSGEKLGSMGDPVIYKHEGREIRFCCPNCLDTFKANPAEGLKKLDEAIIKEQIKAYPLDTCVVSGDKMDHGEPVNVVVQNRLVRLCCDSCKKDLAKDPAKYLAKIDEAIIAKEMKDYPLTTCVVSEHELDSMGKPVDKVYGGHLVRFCCKGCVKDFEKEPGKYLAKIEQARTKKAK